MLLAEVLVAIAAVAQAEHRHHEEERDQAERRKDSTVMGCCTAPLGHCLVLLPSLQRTLKLFLLALLWKSVLSALPASGLSSVRANHW